jgi:hypothetical protein
MKRVFLIFLISMMILYSFPNSDILYQFHGLKKPTDSTEPYPWLDNRVHKAGLLWLNVTNLGAMGSAGYSNDQCTGEPAAGAEMPGGSKKEYLFATSISFGGYLDSVKTDVKGTTSTIFQGPLVSSAYYEEILPYYFDDDPSGLTLGRIYESSNVEGRINCLFDDVYDPKATAYEQFTTRFTDKGTTYSYWDEFDKRGHFPLGIEVKQISYAWPYEYAKKFIIVDYTIYNRNSQGKDIYDFFMGVDVVSSVRNNNNPEYGYMDDICGYKHKWDGYFDPATGEMKTVDLNFAWTADNDGREYIPYNAIWIASEPGAGNVLDGATGSLGIRVLRNPNPNQEYSFNLWTSGVYESKDWGPRWKEGLHSDWDFDLTPKQKGYDDTNYDSLYWREETQGHKYPMYSGRTEGTPAGDSGHYMVMSNGEFDYDLTDIREIYLGIMTQPDSTPIPQAEKWQPWRVSEADQNDDEADEFSDGSIRFLNDIANGKNVTFLLSFGPFGIEAFENVALDEDRDGTIDGFIHKKVWKFAYGDSLKLTLAYIANEDFNTSILQDPNYNDWDAVDINDGLEKSLYDRGWYDALDNVTWAERLYDTPMFDTPVKRWGETKKDGWYGEDVGNDAMFGDLVSDTYCWWLESGYPGPDKGEGDFEITTFTNPIIDVYGEVATNEDNLLPFGRKEWSGDYGPTGNSSDGEGYGYMVKYDKLGSEPPQGTWVRYGYGNDRLDAGDGVPDFTSPPPPPPPKIKISEIDNDVIVEWTSHEFYTGEDGSVGVGGPEFTYDPFTRLYDFEGYSIELSPDRQSKNFTTIFSIDKVNYSYQNVIDVNDYLDNPIPADTLYAHPDHYPSMITSNGKIYNLVPYGDNTDLTQDYTKAGVYSYTCKIDSSRFENLGDIRYYKFTLHNQTLAEMKYIAVTAKDFGAPKMGVPAIKSSPESNATATVTANLTTTNDVVVVPNPYRGDLKYTETGWENIDDNYTYAEEYRKIAFLNIPERCVIRIYTLAGDLCKVIAHNGYSENDTPYWYGKNGAYWNLINDNQQAVYSGIYLFSVQDVDRKKDDFVGKFVIIK